VGRIVGMRGDKMLRVTEDGVEEVELSPTVTFTSSDPAEMIVTTTTTPGEQGSGI
jgi:hypothetical protein